MSYYIANDKEILGQFASNTGYADLIATATEDLAALNSLIEHGVSENVPAVVTDLDRLMKQVRDKDVRSVITNLREMIKKQDLIVVTQG
jgi:hypothetical protein